MKRRMLSLMSCLFVGWVGVASAQEFTDPAAWQQVIRGTGPFMEVTPSRVTITLPGQSQDDENAMFAAFLQTACTVHGDFDVSVDFHLLVWPPLSGARMGMNTPIADVNRIWFNTCDYYGPSCDVYYTTPAGVQIPTTDMNGSLRQTRSGGTLSTYYKDTGGNWVAMERVPAPTTDVFVALAAWSHRQYWAGYDVTVAFDNFHVAAGDFPCFPADEMLVGIDAPPRINPRSQGNIPVSILSTAAFNAPIAVNPATVRFGPTGTEAAPLRWTVEDVNGDGRTDLRLLFAVPASKIPCGATVVSLTGQTRTGQAIHGSDTIMTTGCN